MCENLLIDKITVPEFRDENLAETYVKIFGYLPEEDYLATPSEINTCLRKYLLDHDVKAWEGPVYTFFYREDPKVYDTYLKVTKETHTSKDEILSKEEFFKGYLMTLHDLAVEEE